VNLRPKQHMEVKEETTKETNSTKDSYVKTSVTLSRAIAIRARKYVNDQQVAHAQGQRQSNYSFSKLFDDALNFYLTHLEKGETDEKDA
jgi:hypothetical protein